MPDKGAIYPNWPLQGGVGALMTCRTGGASQPPYRSNNLGLYVGDAHTELNRRQLLHRYRLPSEPLWLKQVHAVGCSDARGLAAESEVDAVWTSQPGQVLAIQTADCLPVLFADRQGQVVAAAHAGWRGLLGGVLEHTLAAMPVQAAEVYCWLGAAIGPCCFEVGEEVRAAFVDAHSCDKRGFTAAAGGRWMADLYLLARRRLEGAGVVGVYGGGLCTACDSQRFFSYRRDQGVTGRMATLVWRSADA